MQEKVRRPGRRNSIPYYVNCRANKREAVQKNTNGEYTAGEKIVPKEYEKLIL